MMKNGPISRRNFVRNSALTAGIASFAPSELLPGRDPGQSSGKEVWIAGVSQMNMRADTADQMADKVYRLLDNVLAYQPDFVCLPEIFPFVYIGQKLTMKDMADISAKVLDKFAAFSAKNNCYTICPVYTMENGAMYNSSVLLDRNGKIAGKYNKIHPTEGEIKSGIACGGLVQPPVATQFGPVGMQICFDNNWDDGWIMLRKYGAKIIFWLSAYGGGQTINTRAWRHKCFVATSTNKGTSKICDISGITIAQSGFWNPNLYCGAINMEKVFLATWPYVNRFNEIRNKYGRKVKITTFDEEEWSIIESLSPDLQVNDILKEFELKTYEEHIASAEIVQNKTRQ